MLFSRKPYFYVPQRWIFVTLAFLAMCIGNGLRVVLSLTITAMVKPKEKLIRQIDHTCTAVEEAISSNITITESTVKLYEWDEHTQGIILSSFFWGYFASQWFFGSLAERFGGKYILAQGILIPSILTFITPYALEWGDSTAFITLRVVMGLSNGSMYPAASAMIPKWTTSTERSKVASCIFSSPLIGAFLSTILPALIIRYVSIGWPAVFYIFGMIGIIWFPLWAVFCYNTPEEHPFISEAELKYLEQDKNTLKRNINSTPPWKYILTSKPAWAFVIAMIGKNWAYFTMLNDLPKYMSGIVKFSIESNGYLSASPYLCMWFFTFISSWVSEKILRNNWMTVTNVRKLLTAISLIVPAIFLMGASYAGCDRVLVVVMFITGMTIMGVSYPSTMLNPLDLSPNYSGTLMSFGNGLAAISGILSPYIVGILTPNQTIGEWRLVFWIVFGFSIFTSIYYIIYASGEVQEWNDPNYVLSRKDKSKKGNENSVNEVKIVK